MTVLLYWPTLLWFLGLLEFLIQTLICGPTAHTYGWSVGLAVVLGLLATWKGRAHLRKSMRPILDELTSSPILFKLLIVITVLILALAGWESLLPPHLSQEFDAINYHMALARQHLIQGSLAHLSWSSADLWPMTLQWGMAPTWFSLGHINKIPQFLFTVWILILTIRLGRRIFPEDYRAWLPAIAFATTHGVMIQLGTAMMDLPILYFLIAGIDAWQTGKRYLSAFHFAVFSTAKAFSPLMSIALLFHLLFFALVLKRTSLKTLTREFKFPLLTTLLLIGLLLSRSAIVSMTRAGTPLFPFGVCTFSSSNGCQGNAGSIIRESARSQIETKDQYGTGRNISAFITHFWNIAVPERGVNNSYDYPLGLAWLLWIVFLVFSIPRWWRAKFVPFYVWFAFGFWLLWWMGSHQSRWLYPTILLGWLGTMEVQRQVRAEILLICLLASGGLSLLSEVRALKSDLHSTPTQIEADMIQNHETSLFSETPFHPSTTKGSYYWILTPQTCKSEPC